MKFLQKDIEKFNENVRKTKVQKIFIYGKKRKAWNRGKRTQMPVTVTEGLAGTDKGYGRWPFLQRSSVTDI